MRSPKRKGVPLNGGSSLQNHQPQRLVPQRGRWVVGTKVRGVLQLVGPLLMQTVDLGTTQDAAL